MNNSNLYIRRDFIVDETHYLAIIKLLKVLYRLEIIDGDTATAVAMEFRPFFV